MDIWITVITAILGSGTTLLAIWYRNKLQNKNKQKEDPIVVAVAEDEDLLVKFDELRDYVGADRATILQFHNGAEFYTGKSMQKVSMTYEVVDKGIERITPAFQNIPVSACNSTLAPLMKDKTFFVHDVEKDYPESLCKFYLIEAGVNSVYSWAIFDLNKLAIGLFRLDFVKSKKTMTQEQIDRIQLNVIKMPGYLS